MAGKKGNTYASKNRKIRQEALREELAAKQYTSRLERMLDEVWVEVEVKDGIPVVVSHVAEMKGKADIMLRLLNKVLPDLKSIEHSGDIVHHEASELTDDELEHIATGSRNGASKTPKGKAKSPAVH